MGIRFVVGDLLSGRRLRALTDVIAGSWEVALNDSDALSCTIPLRNAANRRLRLGQSAYPGKSYLAAIDGDNVLAAGPIWFHDWDEDSHRLTLTASGMWSYFDHRVLIPVLAGRTLNDPTTDTRFMPAHVPDDDDPYAWPTDTRRSLQGIARYLVAQAMSHTGGNVPVTLPVENIAGDNQRDYRGSQGAMVGDVLRSIRSVKDGPDLAFPARLTDDRQGLVWDMKIGTPSKPLLASPLEPQFNLSAPSTSMSKMKFMRDGRGLAARAFGIGGKQSDTVLATTSEDPFLLSAGFPLLEDVDSSHSTVSEASTMQSYTDERVLAGRTPTQTMSFTHQASRIPQLGSFSVGDFCRVKIVEHAYLESGNPRMRIARLKGDHKGKTVAVTCLPEVV